MVFPHLYETFYSTGVEHDNIRPSETTISKEFEKMTINAIEGVEVKREDITAIVHLMSPGATPKNWTTKDISIVFLLL